MNLRKFLPQGLLLSGVFLLGGLTAIEVRSDETIRIASKNFGESYLLSEIAAQLLEARGFTVRRQLGLGGTLICYGALTNDQIDVYIEYTGTITQAILKSPVPLELPQIREQIPKDLELLLPFGFNNTYAMTMRANHLSLIHI